MRALMLLGMLLGLLVPTALAQKPAEVLLEQARLAAEMARATPTMPHPDHPQWADAIALGKEALERAPANPDALRFLAETYTVTGWYIRAWELWHDYARVRGQLQAHEVQQLVWVGRQLGYARYLERDYNEAIRYYQAVLALDAREVQAYVWLARIYLEIGEAATAARYWREVLRLDPEDSRAAYFLQLSEAQIVSRASAPPAYYRGLSLYEAGEIYRAREAFLAATEANPGYVQAWAWLARTRLEQENYRLAAQAYQRALELAPLNRDYQEGYRLASSRAGR